MERTIVITLLEQRPPAVQKTPGAICQREN